MAIENQPENLCSLEDPAIRSNPYERSSLSGLKQMSRLMDNPNGRATVNQKSRAEIDAAKN
jgi:hypothetical protein